MTSHVQSLIRKFENLGTKNPLEETYEDFQARKTMQASSLPSLEEDTDDDMPELVPSTGGMQRRFMSFEFKTPSNSITATAVETPITVPVTVEPEVVVTVEPVTVEPVTVEPVVRTTVVVEPEAVVTVVVEPVVVEPEAVVTVVVEPVVVEPEAVVTVVVEPVVVEPNAVVTVELVVEKHKDEFTKLLSSQWKALDSETKAEYMNKEKMHQTCKTCDIGPSYECVRSLIGAQEAGLLYMDARSRRSINGLGKIRNLTEKEDSIVKRVYEHDIPKYPWILNMEIFGGK
jgi:hypothetical protein